MTIFPKILATILLLSSLLMPMVVQAEQYTATLEVAPTQCVAVRQGQACYADVKIHWQLNLAGEYCLYSSQQNVPLECWKNQRSGRWANEIKAFEDVKFYLSLKQSQQKLATGKLEVAWVYKKNIRKNAIWRMF
ncbi:DUF3019 domain-containing protein [Thalassotalea sp. M1531]|uniref:DUF3019 domain-containing protein n=1 Tax=Thalassotalea algicola TaxID=2716224 RepID=A0A7Y0Q7L9_9GAMM|nr:DUF3019 domain-containing protein [Thalassotalea algicola]NMP31175.1 DUF3019 domain-containing protein [Thalassotalea algicola]